MEVINVAFIGNLNDAYMLSGAGLGNMFFNSFWVAVYLGINGALETLVSQAYGAKNWKLCGETVNTGAFVLLVLFIPVFFLLFFIGDILVWLNVDATSAYYATLYSRALIIGLIMQALYDLLRKFLIMMGRALMPTLIQGFTLPLHFLFNYLLVNKAGMGVTGSGIATSLTFSLNMILVVIVVMCTEETRKCLTWPKPSEILPRSWSYFLLGVPTSLMSCLDIWAFTGLTLISSYLGVYENAGQVIMLNVISILYSIPLGFASACCALVGNQMGKGRHEKAKVYAKQGFFTVMMFSIAPCLMFAIFPDKITGIFTSDPVIIDVCHNAMLFSSIGFFADAAQGTMQGVVKGVG